MADRSMSMAFDSQRGGLAFPSLTTDAMPPPPPPPASLLPPASNRHQQPLTVYF